MTNRNSTAHDAPHRVIRSPWLALAAMALAVTATADPVDWSVYSRSFEISFPGYTGSGTLTDFPVLIRLSAVRNDFQYGKCKLPNGGDLRFSDAEGNLLAHEIDTWNPDGESFIWVKVPSLNANTKITVHYGCDTPVEALPETQVWSNGYIGVWHLGESARPLRDSTANKINFTRSNRYNSGNEYDDCAAFAQVDSAVGRAVKFNPNVEGKENKGGFIAPDDAGKLCGLDAMTIEIWAKVDAFDSASRYLISRRMGNYVDGIKVRGYELEYSSSKRPVATFYLENGQGNDTDYCQLKPSAMSSSLAGKWNYHCASYDKSATSHTNYLNDTVAATVANSTGYSIHAIPDPLCLANDCQTTSTKVFNGSLDELRISNVARSKDWVKATYDTVHDENFADVKIPNDWKQYSHTFSVSFRGYTGTAALTDFPVLVKVSTNDIAGFSYTDCRKPDGGDLRFADDEGHLLVSEVESWDTNGVSTVWVKVPSLSSSTTIKAYYGWAFAPAVDGKDVWSNGFVGVWHLDESTAPLADSLGVVAMRKSSDGTVTFGMEGKVAKAVSFGENGEVNGRIVASDSTADRYDNTATLTVEAWLNPREFTNDRYVIYKKSKGKSYACRTAYSNGAAKMQVTFDLTNETAVASGEINKYYNIPNDTLGTWYYQALVVDNVSEHMFTCYINSSVACTQTMQDGYKVIPSKGDLYIGNISSGKAYTGCVDEVRISNVARSAAWVKATYDTIMDDPADNTDFAAYTPAKENSMGTVIFFR